ncbi:MAG: hypothetical protein Nk1A_4280 [Endomicrobiia bacterium]|nr:MAG: hypothetical protein Nk1A_4280 [Endomicrobiia bacterium]
MTSKRISQKVIVSINGGGVKYGDKIILEDINLSITGNEHLAITGDNGSGKTTLFKAILNYSQISKTGVWNVLCWGGIGYLDQYYNSLDNKKRFYRR